MMMDSTPDSTASSTPYWMTGLSTRTSISLGCALVAGRKRVPSPAAGNTALRMTPSMRAILTQINSTSMLDPALFRDNPEPARMGLRNRGLDLTAELDEL